MMAEHDRQMECIIRMSSKMIGEREKECVGREDEMFVSSFDGY